MGLFNKGKKAAKSGAKTLGTSPQEQTFWKRVSWYRAARKPGGRGGTGMGSRY